MTIGGLMPMEFLRPFHTTVARRVTLLVIGSVLVPLGALALLTVTRTTRELESQARTRLHHDVKAVAMIGIERLALLTSRLGLIGSAVLRGDAALDMIGELVSDGDGAVGFAPEGGVYQPLFGTVTPPPLPTDQASRLARSGAIIVSDARADGTRRHWLVVRATVRGRAGATFALVDHRHLWGIAEHSTLPPSSALCVFEMGVPIVCSDGVPARLARASAALAPNAAAMITVDGRTHLTATWSVPLKYSYFTAPWVVTLLQPREDVRVPLARFTRDFWLVLLLSVLVVTLMSVGQVRRNLRPLGELVRATRRLGARDFDTHVEIRSGDEFQVLGEAVNVLAVELKRRFEELDAFNLGTLEALARTVDAKSPWTAGHSQRVSALAVQLGREMRLSAEQLAQLHRGGLVHDIGKLATPSAVLNKPGPLNERERLIIEEHPGRGVTILEPIAAYAPLLPIVGEHHERWDGSGYPRGLKRDEIALTARVLAVADTFDAITSVRPYRTEMPLPRAAAIISDGAGCLFDPDVVDAFRRLLAKGALSCEHASRRDRKCEVGPDQRDDDRDDRAAAGSRSAEPIHRRH